MDEYRSVAGFLIGFTAAAGDLAAGVVPHNLQFLTLRVAATTSARFRGQERTFCHLRIPIVRIFSS